jgi:predicted MPP superfamily phosphohydrolase
VDLIAPNHWRQVDFISDLHLHAAEPGTHDAWVRYMQSTTADALFILGDVFEVWVGDDTLDDPESFEAACARIIRHTSERMSVFIMRGNRDFLIGERLAQACNAQLLEDPSTFQFLDTRIVPTAMRSAWMMWPTKHFATQCDLQTGSRNSSKSHWPSASKSPQTSAPAANTRKRNMKTMPMWIQPQP